MRPPSARHLFSLLPPALLLLLKATRWLWKVWAVSSGRWPKEKCKGAELFLKARKQGGRAPDPGPQVLAPEEWSTALEATEAARPREEPKPGWLLGSTRLGFCERRCPALQFLEHHFLERSSSRSVSRWRPLWPTCAGWPPEPGWASISFQGSPASATRHLRNLVLLGLTSLLSWSPDFHRSYRLSWVHPLNHSETFYASHGTKWKHERFLCRRGRGGGRAECLAVKKKP